MVPVCTKWTVDMEEFWEKGEVILHLDFLIRVSQVKERTRGEQGEEKKLTRMLVDMEDMFGAMGKTLGEDIFR